MANGFGKRVTMTFKPDGTVESDLDGFEDASCKDVQKKLLDGLGEVIKDSSKPEAYRCVTKKNLLEN